MRGLSVECNKLLYNLGPGSERKLGLWIRVKLTGFRLILKWPVSKQGWTGRFRNKVELSGFGSRLKWPVSEPGRNDRIKVLITVLGSDPPEKEIPTKNPDPKTRIKSWTNKWKKFVKSYPEIFWLYHNYEYLIKKKIYLIFLDFCWIGSASLVRKQLKDRNLWNSTR